MSMLSTLDALEASEGASVPRAGVFQPKVKARIRKGGSRGDGGATAAAKPPPAVPAAAKHSPAAPVADTTESLDLKRTIVEDTHIPQPGVKTPDALVSKENDAAPELSDGNHGIADSSRHTSDISPVVECAPAKVARVTSPTIPGPVKPAPEQNSSSAAEPDNIVAENTVHVGAQESRLINTQESCISTQEYSQPVAVRSSFPVPSSSVIISPTSESEEAVHGSALPLSEEPPSNHLGYQEGEPKGVTEPARPTKLRNSARKNRKTSTTPTAPEVPRTTSQEAVDDDVEGALSTINDEVFAEFAMQEEHTGTSGRKRRRAFPHSTSRPRGQTRDGAESSKQSRSSRANCDLSNPSTLPLREVIRRAENIERKKAKDEMARKSLLDVSNPKERDACREPEPPRDVLSLAPQVQVINGRIVVNEQTLTVGAYATTAQDIEQYKRVEEKASRLNYNTYSNRPVTERWKPEETDLFYKAITQFGTDFDLIQNLFPTRTRRQIKAKYKKEETVNPQRVADALTYRPKDQSHYEEMLSRMKRDDLIQDTSDPFASILAYSVEKAEKSDRQERAEVDDTQTEEEILAPIVQ